MPVIVKFFRSLLLLTALVYLTGFLLFSTVLSDHFLPVFYFLGLYFMLLTIGGRLLMLKSDMNKPGSFNARYFLVRWVKVLLHMVFIVVYILNDRENILAFILVFLAGYLLYSVYDIYTLNSYVKKK
jgi:hypothetical protein